MYTYLIKGDSTKAKSCVEKALAYRPNFPEAFYLLCVITWNQGHALKVVSLIEDFESKHDRTLPFTYLFKGVSDFQLHNYVSAIESFHNVAKFHELHTNQEKAG